jgi:hypothetical protein
LVDCLNRLHAHSKLDAISATRTLLQKTRVPGDAELRGNPTLLTPRTRINATHPSADCSFRLTTRQPGCTMPLVRRSEHAAGRAGETAAFAPKQEYRLLADC